MKSGRHALCLITAIALAVVFSLTAAHNLLAQGGTGSLRGQVVDPSGGAVVSAPVQVTTSSGQTLMTTTNGVGTYELGNVAPGAYTVELNVKGFAHTRRKLCKSCPARSSSSTSRSRCKANKSKSRFPEKP